MITEYIHIFLAAALGGALYGISFLLQHRTLLGKRSIKVNRVQAVGYFLIRILILWATARYLLRKPTFLFILATVLFFAVFWLTLLLAKARSYERL